MLRPRWLLIGGLLMLIVWFGLNQIQSQTTSNMIGKQAPDWTLNALDGKSVRFADFRGNVILIDLWATWCPPCRQEIPGFIALQKQYAASGLVVIGISLDESATPVKEFVKKNAMNYPVVMGNRTTANLYGDIRGIPTTFLVDRSGKIVNQYVGFHEKSVFETAIQPLLKEKSPVKK